jgi:hypothetical protein
LTKPGWGWVLFVGEMVVMMADKTHKEEEDKKMEDEVEDEYGVDVPVRLSEI